MAEEKLLCPAPSSKALTIENEVLEELEDAAPARNELPKCAMAFRHFLFSGDDVFKKIKILSGGEKARVALSKGTSMQKATSLALLDEPTNHLDMQSSGGMLIDFPPSINIQGYAHSRIARPLFCKQDDGNKI